MHVQSLSNDGCHHTDVCCAALQTHSSWQQSSMSQAFYQQIQVSYVTFHILAMLLCHPGTQLGHATAALQYHLRVTACHCYCLYAMLQFWHASAAILLCMACSAAAFMPHSKDCLLLFHSFWGLFCGVKGMSTLDSGSPTPL